MSTISKVTHSPAETRELARDVVLRGGPGLFLALNGDLGAGKTCFVQGVAAALGVRGPVSSPTFTIVNEYASDNGSIRLLHADLYRLSGPEELNSIGWDDYLRSGSAMAVEWPDRAEGELPERTITVNIEIPDNPDERIFDINFPDTRDDKKPQTENDPEVTYEILKEACLSPEAVILQSGRNLTVRAPLKTSRGIVDAAIKRFPASSFSKGFPARWRRTKARRSFEAAVYLRKNVGPCTPEPIAYVDNDPDGNSWFVTRFEYGLSTFGRELIRIYNAGGTCAELVELLNAVAVKCAELHDSGFMHNDLGNQNIVIAGIGTRRNIMFIDLNRSRIRQAPLTNKERARDLSRINLPSDLRRIFLDMYWRGEIPPDEFLKAESNFRRRFAFHCATRRIRHPFRKKGASPDGVYPKQRDIWIWDERSEQPMVILRPVDRRKYQSISRILDSMFAFVFKAPNIFRTGRLILRQTFELPVIDFGRRLLISVSAAPDKFETEKVWLKKLGCSGTHIRFSVHDTAAETEYKLNAAEELRSAGYYIAVSLLQNRDAVLNLEKWDTLARKILSRLASAGIEWFEVGHAVNRVKWGCWNFREAAALFKFIPAWRKDFPGVKFIGPSAIDFEWDYLLGICRDLPRDFKFDALSHHLYVDRRGAPESFQGEFDTVGKISRLISVGSVSGHFSGTGIIISEFNWPIAGTGVWSPVGSPYVSPSPRHNDPSVDEETAAVYTLRYVLLAIASGMVSSMVFLSLAAHGFGLVDTGESPSSGEWRARPAFTVISVLYALLGECHFCRCLSKGEDKTWVLEFADKQDRPIAAVWTFDRTKPRGLPKLDFEINQVVDMFGVPIPVPTSLSDKPVYIIG